MLLQYLISDDDTLIKCWRTHWMLVFVSLCVWSWVALVTMSCRNPHKLPARLLNMTAQQCAAGVLNRVVATCVWAENNKAQGECFRAGVCWTSKEMSRVTFSEAQKTQYADRVLLRAGVLVLQRHLLIQKYICQIDSRNLTWKGTVGRRENFVCLSSKRLEVAFSSVAVILKAEVLP